MCWCGHWCVGVDAGCKLCWCGRWCVGVDTGVLVWTLVVSGVYVDAQSLVRYHCLIMDKDEVDRALFVVHMLV